MKNIGNAQDEERINSLLTTEKNRDKSRRLEYLKTISKRAEFNRLRIEYPDVEGREKKPPRTSLHDNI